jgi:hypothetical protein
MTYRAFRRFWFRVQPLVEAQCQLPVRLHELAGESASMKSRTMALGLAVNLHPAAVRTMKRQQDYPDEREDADQRRPSVREAVL